MQDYPINYTWNIFIYTLGGIYIGVKVDCQCFQEHSCSLEKKRFIYSADCEKHSVTNRDISVRFALLDQKVSPQPINKIFSQKLSDFYTTRTGYVQFFYLTAAKKELAWTLKIDHTFSQFDYFICADKVKVLDFFDLSVRLFLLQHSLIERKGLIVHAAGGSVQGKGIIFAAPSGTGKSTLSGLLQHGTQTRLFSEERLIIRSIKDQWHVWGTPWHGEGNIAQNESAPLSALLFLKQSKQTKITQLSRSDGLYRLIQTVSIPWYSKKWTDKGLARCEALVQEMPMFELAFRPDQTAVQAVERFAADL
ncbi:MAG: hypothetical protein D3916_08795 [Candidatus Electrothrix sp. MAN1_4]|nr:hypothetical protein [Candidatus Electrothrix sp. MAN1_4]